jgi:hypothetical protein
MRIAQILKIGSFSNSKLHRTQFSVEIPDIFLRLKMTIPRKSKFCNKFVITIYAIKSFMFYCYFHLAGILSFQKMYICPKKLSGTSKLFKKM